MNVSNPMVSPPHRVFLPIFVIIILYFYGLSLPISCVFLFLFCREMTSPPRCFLLSITFFTLSCFSVGTHAVNTSVLLPHRSTSLFQFSTFCQLVHIKETRRLYALISCRPQSCCAWVVTEKHRLLFHPFLDALADYCRFDKVRSLANGVLDPRLQVLVPSA